MDRFAAILAGILPVVLGTINPALMPLSGLIIHGITVARGMPGATGDQKLASVVDLVTTGAESLNAGAVAQGHAPLVDVSQVQATSAAAISTAYNVAKLIHDTPPPVAAQNSTASQK